MAVSTRVIKGRIKSAQSTKKITKAMELVSAAKMRRAVHAVTGSRPYARLSWELIQELAALDVNGAHPLLDARATVKKILMFITASDRGLCGGFNAQLLKRAATYANVMKTAGVSVDVVTIGRRAELAAKKMGWNMVASFASKGNALTAQDLVPMAHFAREGFLNNTYDRVVIAYTDFVSSLRQEPKVRQILPLGPELELGSAHTSGEPPSKSEHLWAHIEDEELVTDESEYDSPYVFEPSARELLDAMVPRLLESQVYQALLESNASEHAARMIAMQSASKAASEFIDDLTFSFNQARQASITREIAEISSGKVTLE